MDPREYELMRQVEDRHWWYGGMAVITRRILNRCYSRESRLYILDAGCGTGAAMTSYLAEYGRVTGLDLHPLALKYCRRRGNSLRLTRASTTDLPFASENFDLVTSLDVLYERAVTDDLRAVRELARVLVPGGRLLLRLPAYDWLRGRHDAMIHTRRRYTTPSTARLLEDSGLRVELLSYANTFLFPLAVLKRFMERFLPSKEGFSDLAVNVGPMNDFFQSILGAEAPLVAGMGLPFGLSVFAVGRKG